MDLKVSYLLGGSLATNAIHSYLYLGNSIVIDRAEELDPKFYRDLGFYRLKTDGISIIFATTSFVISDMLVQEGVAVDFFTVEVDYGVIYFLSSALVYSEFRQGLVDAVKSIYSVTFSGL